MWLAAEKLPKKFNFKLDDMTTDEPVEFAQELAAADLEDWLSADDFALGEASDEPSDAAQKRRQKRIVNAHAYLTVYYIFLNNTQIRASGTVGSEKSSDNDGTVNYLKPKELEELRAMFLNQAKNLIASFATVNFSNVIESTEPSSDYAHYAPAADDCDSCLTDGYLC